MTEATATVSIGKYGTPASSFRIPLKECPFCGNIPSMEIEYKEDRFYESIECADCHLIFFGDANEHISERWNTRKEIKA